MIVIFGQIPCCNLDVHALCYVEKMKRKPICLKHLLVLLNSSCDITTQFICTHTECSTVQCNSTKLFTQTNFLSLNKKIPFLLMIFTSKSYIGVKADMFVYNVHTQNDMSNILTSPKATCVNIASKGNSRVFSEEYSSCI